MLTGQKSVDCFTQLYSSKIYGIVIFPATPLAYFPINFCTHDNSRNYAVTLKNVGKKKSCVILSATAHMAIVRCHYIRSNHENFSPSK